MNEASVVRDVDWQNWQPGIRATLMFVVGDGKVLLIHKKRGIGMGKINGPGGKIDPGETPLEAAVRETREELHVSPLNAVKMGELWFAMTHIPDIHCHVFMATEWQGEATETPEAVPLWTPLEDVPYDRMWEDDRHWLPQMLAGGTFRARFIFEEERIRWQDIQWGVEWRE